MAVEGEVAKPAVWNLEDILKGQTLEDRIYRHRCVEALVDGDSVGRLSARRLHQAGAADVESEVRRVHDAGAIPIRCPGCASPSSAGRTSKGLRMDEAMHPLTILAVGLYGEVLPNQNGAPIRLVVPWKYGFKSAKSIVKIRFVEQQPVNSWQLEWPQAYGFYANVNPTVRAPALGSGEGNPAARAVPESHAPRCSTATAIRWQACTPAWI